MKWTDDVTPALRDDAEATSRHRGRKKNTHRWCKGKVGVEHCPQIVLGHTSSGPCKETGWYDRAARVWCSTGRWVCWHIEACARCGKHLRFTVTCPENTRGLPQSIF